MVETSVDRQLVLRARARLEEWTIDARVQAYADLFESDDPMLTAEELQLLDSLDSALERGGGDGVWGTDQYGIHTGGSTGDARSIDIVCVYHPQITSDSVLRGMSGLDDETEERLNAALWDYSERVATLIGQRLDEFVQQTQE